MKSIEYKIRFKAAIIYMIVALGVIVTIIYLYNLRKSISSQRHEIENQRALLSSVNNLMFAVSEAQASSSLYLSTKNKTHLRTYDLSVNNVERLIDTIVTLKPGEEKQLNRIETLLRRQARNITELNTKFTERNPVEAINERIQDYKPVSESDTLHIVNISHDTIVSKQPKKKFFKRVAEVFKPEKDSVKITVNQRIDTVKSVTGDSTAITEIIDITQNAQNVYTLNIQTIEKQVNELISSDKEIASEISMLLLKLHRETLDTTLSIIYNSEKAIDRNYTYSTVGGVFALILVLIFIALIITDINKGREARQALEAANERTREIMESRHKLLLSVSHDIKSPLNSILGYLGLMKNEPNVRSMQNSSEHILSMLENLLEFSSLEQGKVQKSMSDFNLHDLCRDIYDMFLPLAQQKSLVLSFNGDNVRIHTDRVKLKQIIINIVSNAIKYTKKGTVKFSAYLKNNELQIEVTDTGAGIPEDKLEQLFKPFSRIEQNNTLADGTGLGMFVTKGLIELLEGEINISSEVGKGTRFLIKIPAERATKDIPQGTKKIKIYDDDPVIIKMVSDMLVRLGHYVVDEGYDLILTDMEMGDISGVDILREAGSVPVVVMTGRADFTQQKAAEMGFDQFLAKPFTIDSLCEVVGRGESFDDLLGDNRDEIMELFRSSTEENFKKLAQAVKENNFKQAQSICHKMFPMFAQMGYPTEELRKIDSHRDGEYEGWQKDISKILSRTIDNQK